MADLQALSVRLWLCGCVVWDGTEEEGELSKLIYGQGTPVPLPCAAISEKAYST
jgi:hypothetical protein